VSEATLSWLPIPSSIRPSDVPRGEDWTDRERREDRESFWPEEGLAPLRVTHTRGKAPGTSKEMG
jgi:hypothetical protein